MKGHSDWMVEGHENFSKVFTISGRLQTRIDVNDNYENFKQLLNALGEIVINGSSETSVPLQISFTKNTGNCSGPFFSRTVESLGKR